MRFRPPVPDDAPAVLAVFAAREMADIGAPIHRLEDLREEWQGTELDLEDDARVVEADAGRIVAYAAVRRHGTLAVVAPQHEGRGIGARLLEWAEGRERAHGHPRYRQWVAATNASARELLTRAGYCEGPQLLAPEPSARGDRRACAATGGLAPALRRGGARRS